MTQRHRMPYQYWIYAKEILSKFNLKKTIPDADTHDTTSREAFEVYYNIVQSTQNRKLENKSISVFI